MTDNLRANTRPLQPGQFQPRLLATAVSLAIIQMSSAWAQTTSAAPAAAQDGLKLDQIVITGRNLFEEIHTQSELGRTTRWFDDAGAWYSAALSISL